jgi:hypothetical protein
MPFGRAAMAEEIGYTVAFLASPLSGARRARWLRSVKGRGSLSAGRTEPSHYFQSVRGKPGRVVDLTLYAPILLDIKPAK